MDATNTVKRARGGVDLGGTKVQVVVIDHDHRVIGSARRPTPTSGGPDAVADAMADALREAAASANIDTSSLSGIGIGSPGACDVRAGTVSGARNLPGFDGVVPLAALVAARTGVQRVTLGNDVGVALDAEAQLGAGAGLASFVGVWWGTGIGGGVVMHGNRWLGRGAAGEIGHTIVRRNGAPCPCGRLGCLEAYAGRRAMELRARKLHDLGRKSELFEIMRKKSLDRLTAGVWAKALEREDKVAVHLMRRAELALAAGIASAVNLLDVEAVVIGGGLGTRLGQPVADRIAVAMLPHLLVRERPPKMRIAALGDLSGAIGASLLVADKS